MGMIVMDGFDAYSASNFEAQVAGRFQFTHGTFGNTMPVSTPLRHLTGQCLRGAHASSWTWNFDLQTGLVVGAAAIRHNQFTAQDVAILRLLSPSGTVAGMYINSTDTNILGIGAAVELRVNGVVVGGTPRHNANEWNHWKIVFNRHETEGFVHLYRNNFLVVAYEGDTLTWNDGVNRMVINAGLRFDTSQWIYIDDVYVADQDYNDQWIFIAPPNADNQAQWDPSTGTDNFAMVDDKPQDGDGTYVRSSLVGAEDHYGLPPLAEDFLINHAQVLGFVRSEEVTSDLIRLGIISGAFSEEGDSTVTNEYNCKLHPIPVNPDGNVQWTRAALANALLKLRHEA